MASHQSLIMESKMKSTRIRPRRCLNCSHEMDVATCVSGAHAPKPGDVTICISCGHIMVFDKRLRFRNPMPSEIPRIAANKELLAIQRARTNVGLEKLAALRKNKGA